jgi:hypothetical protein
VAAEIVPIELSLTNGNGVTLWAPQWTEDGDEWEAFLGHGEALYLFPSAAHLAAFIRTNDEHDLADHPQWEIAKRAMADELVPDENHRFDIVGVPDLVAEPPDVWALAELADTVSILQSLAAVCDLPGIDDVLGSAAGFTEASKGAPAFVGRPGVRLWDEVGAVVVDRWDSVIEALDGIVTTPEVDATALSAAQAELEAVSALAGEVEPGVALEGEDDVVGDLEDSDQPAERDPELIFWDEVGIDCLEIGVADRVGWTLRCYLDDTPVFLAAGGRILIFSSPEGLENFIVDTQAENSLSDLEAWASIKEGISAGDAAVLASPENTYQVDGLAEDLLEGPQAVSPGRLSLAVELLSDAATTRKDDDLPHALSSASPLGSLVNAIVKPAAGRMAPAPPYDDEVAAWTAAVDTFAASLEWDPSSAPSRQIPKAEQRRTRDRQGRRRA